MRGTVQPTLPGATPGDLRFVLPYRYLRDILEMLEAMDALAPGVNARDTLLYGAEVKFYCSAELDEGLQTEIGGPVRHRRRRRHHPGPGAGRAPRA